MLKLDPTDGAALLEYFIGREAFWLRRYDTAIAALERSQSLDPTYANAGITLANVYYDRRSSSTYRSRRRPLCPSA